jgi:predicted NACHT family NTPase
MKIEPKQIKGLSKKEVVRKSKTNIKDIKRSKKTIPNELETLVVLRTIQKEIANIQGAVNELFRWQGGLTKDLQSFRQNMFFNALKSGLKNKKKIKKNFDKEQLDFLRRCGVKNKILTESDMEKIKSRYKID